MMNEIAKKLNTENWQEVNKLLYQVDIQSVTEEDIAFLNELLLNPNHFSHQVVARLLQDAKSPSSIPYVKKILDSNFDFLAYTCSEDGVIAKWFSHLLAAIGTKTSIEMIREYSTSKNEGIREEMTYRLKKIMRT